MAGFSLKDLANGNITLTPSQPTTTTSTPTPITPKKKSKNPTARDAYARIGEINKTDPTAANQYLSQLRTLQNTPGTSYYNAYTGVTNRSVANLGSMGYDVSNINSDWYDKYTEQLSPYLLYTGTTNTPSKPGKNATKEQLAAYEFYQINKQRELTESAQNELNALNNELRYWTNAPDWNMTDDEIVEHVLGVDNSRLEKKYPTLYKMYQSQGKNGGTVLELNTPIDFSMDSCYGTIWAARNGYTAEDPYSNESYIIKSALGEGKQWEENPDIRNMRDPKNPAFKPYGAGCTMDEERAYFGVDSFSNAWCDDHRAEIEASGDEDAIKHFNKVAKALEFADACEDEKKNLYEEIDNRWRFYTDNPQALLDDLYGSGNYSHLSKLDDTTDGKGTIDGLVDMPYAFDYRRADVEQYLLDKIANNGQSITDTVTQEAGDTDKALLSTKDKNLNAAGGVYETAGTEVEKTAYRTAKSPLFQRATEEIAKLAFDQNQKAHEAGEALTKQTAVNYMEDVRMIHDYDNHQKALDDANAELKALEPKIAGLVLKSKNTLPISTYDMDILKNIAAGKKVTNTTGGYGDADLASIKKDLESKDKNTHRQGLAAMWNMVQASKYGEGSKTFLDLTDKEMEAAYAEAEQWWGYIKNGDLDKVNRENALTPNELDDLNAFQTRRDELRDTIKEEENWLNDNMDAYDEANEHKARMSYLWNVGANLYAKNGEYMDTSLMGTMDTFYQLSQEYRSPDWNSLNMYELAVQGGHITEEEAHSYAQYSATASLEMADQLESTMNYLLDSGCYIEKNELTNIQSQIDGLRNDGKSAAYYQLDTMPDYDEMAEIGMKIFADKNPSLVSNLWENFTGNYDVRLADITHGFTFGSMWRLTDALNKTLAQGEINEDEMKRYCYLLACDEKYGTDDAQQYMDFLTNEENGALRTRLNGKAQKMVRDYAESGNVQGALAYVFSFASNASQGMLSLGESFKNAVNQKKTNPYNGMNVATFARDYTSVARDVALNNFYKMTNADTEGEKKAAQVFFGAFTSAVDSYINSLMVGPLGELVGWGVGAAFSKIASAAKATAWGQKIVGWVDKFGSSTAGDLVLKAAGKIGSFTVKAGKDFMTASYMGYNAASQKYVDSIKAGYSPEQATQLAYVSFLAETVTEAITMGNIGEAFKMGEKAAVDGMKSFGSMLIKDGLEEALGEGFGAWWESNAERYILGAYSNYEQTVKKYTDAGYPLAIAQQYADQEMWSDVLTEAASAFISAGFTTSVSAGFGEAVGDIRDIRQQNAAIDKIKQDIINGLVDEGVSKKQATNYVNRTVKESKKEAKKNEKAASKIGTKEWRDAHNPDIKSDFNFQERTAEVSVENQASVDQVNNEISERERQERETKEAQDRELKELTLMFETQSTTDTTQATANISAVLQEDADSNEATAAAMNIVDKIAGGDNFVAGALVGGLRAAGRANPSAVKNDIVWAANTNGTANQVLKNIAQRVANQGRTGNGAANTITIKDVFDLHMGIVADLTGKFGESHRAAFKNAVRDSRIAIRMNEKISDGALNNNSNIKNQEAAVEAAKNNVKNAEDSLAQAQAEAKAAAESLTAAEAEFDKSVNRKYRRNDNGLETAATLEQAALHVAGKVNEVTAAEKQAEVAKQKQQQEEEKLQQVKEAALNDVRQEAAAEIDQEIATETQEVAQQAMEEAQAQAQEDVESGKATEVKTDDVIEDLLNMENVEESERDARRKELKDQAEKIVLKKIDLTKVMNNTEGKLAMATLARKLNMDIRLSKELPKGTRGMYSNGTVYLNYDLIKNGKMTIGQALVEAALHEITHAMEGTKSYSKYRTAVLGSLFGIEDTSLDAKTLYDTNDDYHVAIKNKIDKYRDLDPKMRNEETMYDRAEREVIADFARTKLNDRKFVMRMIDEGAGVNMKNALHNINQSLKNFLGVGSAQAIEAENKKIRAWNEAHPDQEQKKEIGRTEWFKQAEYFRRAERSFQKGLDQVAKQKVHPAGDQFSVQQFANAARLDLKYDNDTLTLYKKDGTEIDGVNVRVTPDMMVNTPVGMLIQMGLSADVITDEKGDTLYYQDENGNDILDDDGNKIARTQQGDALKMFADLMNLCARYKENNLIWEIAGSEFAASYSSLKANADTQYKNTVDFGTICAKTQAIVNVLSKTMVDMAKETEKWNKDHEAEIKAGKLDARVFEGITREGIIDVYNATHEADLTVPCPVCYVFSRWMGVPSLLGQMNRFQHEFVATVKDENGNTVYDENGDAVIDMEATKKLANDYYKKMLDKYGDKETIDEKKTKLNNRINANDEQIPKLRENLIALQKKQKGADPYDTERADIRANLENPDLTKAERNKMLKRLDTLDRWSARDAAKLQNRIDATEKAITDKIAESDQATKDLADIEAFNWVTQALCHQVKKGVNEFDADGNLVVDTAFRLTPEDILFDLNRTGEFTGYTKNWQYRNSRGASMGKAIMPYSGAEIGDIINGTAKRWSTEQNPFANMTYDEAKAAFDKAKIRTQQQNLLGGQRLQSTSDFRPEWGLDYVMSFLELQALGSKVQMYTKVAEAVSFLGSIGADANESIMGSGNGWHLASDAEIATYNRVQADRNSATEEEIELADRMGITHDANGEEHVYVMDFSGETGMDYNTAKEYSKTYNSVQMILVGMNDIHIRLAIGNSDIDFVIPWHSSGNSKDTLKQLVAAVKETLEESSDYSRVQSDKQITRKAKNAEGKTVAVDGRTEDQIKLWDARVKLLTEGSASLTDEEVKVLRGNKYTKELYRRFSEEGYDPDCWDAKNHKGITLLKDQAEQVFPYEYWDKNSTRENADVNGLRFIEYCNALGLVPRFSGAMETIKGKTKKEDTKVMFGNFSGAVYNEKGEIVGYDPEKMVKGYWKLLIDRKMYDNNILNPDGTVKEYGKYRAQQVVDVTKASIGQLPKSTKAKYGNGYEGATDDAVFNAKAVLKKRYDETGSYSAYGETTLADMEQYLNQNDADYMAAVERGDMRAAQKDVDFAAVETGAFTDESGNPIRLYHGTRSFGWTEFDLKRTKYGIGAIFTSSNDSVAGGYAGIGRERTVSSKYIPDDGTDETFIKNAKNIAEKDVVRLTEEKAAEIRQKLLGEFRTLAELEYKATEENPSYSPPDEISMEFWDVAQAFDYFLNEDNYLFDDDLDYRERYRNSDNTQREIIQKDFYKEWQALRDYFSNNPEEKARLMSEGKGYYNLLLVDLSHADGLIDLELEYKALLNPEDKFIYTKNDNIVSRGDLQDYIEKYKGNGVYAFYGFPGDNPLIIDAENAFWTGIKAPVIGDEYYTTDYIVKWAKNNGYTSVVIKNVMDPGESNHYGDDYAFFNENQIKSADTVTYDDNGNVIPLNQRFSISPDIRYSAGGDMTLADMEQYIGQRDNAYMDAVERGDMETAQQMADDAASENGYNLSTYHGTSEYFNVFRLGEEGIHLGNMEQASQLANSRYESRSKTTEYKWTDIRDSVPQMNEEQRWSLVERAWILGDYFDGGADIAPFTGDISDADSVKSYVDNVVYKYKENGNRVWGDPFGTTTLRLPTFDRQVGRRVMKLYSKINNPFVIDTDITEWTPNRIALAILNMDNGTNKIWGIGGGELDLSGSDIKLSDLQRDVLDSIVHFKVKGDEAWDAIADVLGLNDYDGIKYRNLYEGDKNSYSYIALHPSDVKLADAVTYDDNGNVIPLSDRFSSNEDIRYSKGGKTTESDLERRLVEAGIITPEDAYSLPLEGKNPAMTSSAPGPQRQFNIKMLQDSDEISAFAKRMAAQQASRGVDTNVDQLARGIRWVASNAKTPNSTGLYEALQKVTDNEFDYRSADGQARMVAMMGLAVAQDDSMAQAILTDAFGRQGTDLGRALQARKLFLLMTPEGRAQSMQNMLKNASDEILKRTGRDPKLKLSDWVLEAAKSAVSETDFNLARMAAATEIAEQLPANWKDKLRAWRMLSMLLNPRTHVRNILGNAFFVPAIAIKNKLGAVAELGMKKGNRTKTLSPFLTKEIRQFAQEDARFMRDVLTGESKYNEDTIIQHNQKMFGQASNVLSKTLGKTAQWLSDINSTFLEGEDWFFLRGHYRKALGGWMMANGYTVADVKANPSLLLKGRAYAIEEAQKATYRDFSKLAQTLNQVSRNGGVAGFVVDAALPFKKTPLNILKRGMDYSVVGVARAITTDMYHLKQYLDYTHGKLESLPEKAITPNQFIDRVCAGLTGTAVMAIGYLLSSLGIVSVGLDDDDDKLEKAMGGQEYALNLKFMGIDGTYTMDWAAPVCMPFFVGAAINEAVDAEGELDANSVLNAILNIAEPVTNLSMLDGVNSLFRTSQYDDTDTITQIAAKLVSNYVTSFVPSALGAAARTADPYRRRAYVPSNENKGVLGTFRYAAEQTLNKIPGVSSSHSIPYRDVWGEPIESSGFERAMENWVSPGYYNAYNNDPILNEIKSVFVATDDQSILPQDPSKTIKYKNQTYYLSAQQYDTYCDVKGHVAKDTMEQIMATDEYQNGSPEEQRDLIKGAWTYADQMGKAAALPDYKPDNYGNDPVKKIVTSGAASYYSKELLKALDDEDWETYNSMYTKSIENYMDSGMKEKDAKQEIKDDIAGIYRDQYKEAYLERTPEGNQRMYEIEAMLNRTGFDFDFKKWRKDADEKAQQ